MAGGVPSGATEGSSMGPSSGHWNFIFSGSFFGTLFAPKTLLFARKNQHFGVHFRSQNGAPPGPFFHFRTPKSDDSYTLWDHFVWTRGAHFSSFLGSHVYGSMMGILGSSWGILGRLGAILGPSWVVLVCLGSSWGRLRLGPQKV